MPAVARIGDADVPHCSPMTRQGGSPNVFANGIPISRQGDLNTLHKIPRNRGCGEHQAPITTGSRTVFINSRGCGRIGDAITGCTKVSAGSSNVFAGG